MHNTSETLLSIPVESFRKRVQEIMPDLSIDTIELNQDGLINDVVIINKTLVFRFTKKPAYNKLLEKELNILDLIRDRVGVEVPDPLMRLPDCVVYPYLQGQPLLRETILAASESTQFEIAKQLGTFLHALHSTPVTNTSIPQTNVPVTREIWVEKYEKTKEKIYPLLLPFQIRWVENLFNNAFDQTDFFEYEPALIHGDLAPYHILYDELSSHIRGVIDFGVAGIGNAALDIGVILRSYGESFAEKMAKTYPQLEKHMPRARFGAHVIELEWVLNGLEYGENFWFTAHIGGAKDIK